ncbi:PssE/Cps14G family polysaccharide biosynthesis glycosyltransferase [Metabacillus iocasae]|uniref:UDP-N-acetylglucosamine transferase subunit ALG13 n=1 Tax=Priestia iocasae TaxID=2291674 RepID=A0ABS2QWX8_9BACI|nr:PssE/Cps14G family polysaccharide biosynthesis glycosyltransferase [Metabacillus iocasae]MBM7703975.1 UDP-N-acetylglucosamine transferase subunit ALG13 [Metabacillus iocasae]
MILVVLGTHELPFTRLLNAIDEQVERGIIRDEVIVQVGHTPFESQNMKLVKFTSYEEMDRLYDQAAYIITHGGTGSITTGLKKGKKMIAAPRLVKYGEHNDNHQLEIVNQFEATGHLIAWHDGIDLSEAISKMTTFEPAPFQSGRKQIISILKDFIEKS